MMESGPAPLVSVLLPVRNEAGHLSDCLDAVLAQSYPRDRMEILIADGMSEDGTRALVERYASRDPRVRLVDNPGRIVPTGLNAALEACRGELIVRVDGHTIIDPDYVEETVGAFRRTGADIVGGAMHAVGRSAFGRAVALATSTPMGVGGSRFHYGSREEPAESVYMGSFRRDVFERFGKFNEGLVRNQDDEFNYRVRSRGGKIFLVPAIRSRYFPREAPWPLFRQYFQYGLYKIRVAMLHPRMARPRHFIPSAFVLLLGGLAGLAPWLPPAGVGLLLLLGVHALLSLAFSARPGSPDPAAWLLVPLSTLILHLGYGSGLLAGCVAALLGRTPGASPRKAHGSAA